MDALEPVTDDILEAAAEELVQVLRERDPGLVVERRLVGAAA